MIDENDKPKSMKQYKRWQDENKTSVWEKLFWLMLILIGCLYATHGHEILNKLIVDIIG